VKIWDVFLGIMSAIGGNVDIGQLVFTIQGGAKFAYQLLWVVVIGTIGITIYAEMSGRVAVVTRKPAFTLVRESMGERRGLTLLIAAVLVNVITCTAEVGGIGVVLQLLFGGSNRIVMVAGTLALLAALGFMKFDALDRMFGLLGLALVVYLVAAIRGGPDWSAFAQGFVPRPPDPSRMPGAVVYAYFVVALFSALLMSYEVNFYSSGAIEEKWTIKDLPANFMNGVVGFALGGVLTLALIVVGAEAYFGSGVDPHLLGTVATPIAWTLGYHALVVALVGIFFAIAGAAAETSLANAYTIAQFFGKPWGKNLKWREAPVFHASWLGSIVVGLVVSLSGAKPLDVVQYSVLFAVVLMPFNYYPILRVADDRAVMGEHANKPLVRWLGWIFLVLIAVAAIAAVPLMIVTHNGEG
jgi:Mn2+/Fe2+ NRAMP family transporter